MAITNNKEYISATLGGFNVSDDDIDLILLKAGMNGEGPIDIQRCDDAIYNRLSVVLKAASANVSEGGYSVSWNMEALKLYYATLCSELGKPNKLEQSVPQPRIKNMSDVW